MKKRTNLTTKVITLMLAMVLVVSLFPTSVMAASTKGPSDGFCFIRIEKSETERIHIFFPQAAAAGTTVEKVSGFSYDKKTNTLTIKNVKQPKWVLNVNEMGSDFKIKVVGTNELYGVTAWGFGYAGSVEFTGTGKLTLNKAKTRSEAITIMAEESKSVLKVGKKVTLNAYAGKKSKNSVSIEESTVKKASGSMIFSNGTSAKKAKTTKMPVVKTAEMALQMDFGDAGVMEYSSSAILLSKKGSKKQYATLKSSETGKWMIYEVTTEVGAETGLPLLKYLKDSADYEKDGYKATVTGYVYTHTYSGDLLLKSK